MYFGGKSFDAIPKSRLVAFEDCIECSSLPNGIVFIQLYEDPADFDLPENRARQEAFRSHIAMVELAEMALSLASETLDPIYEIESDQCEHGGTRLITTWLDDYKLPTRKAKATRFAREEINDLGQVVWSEENVRQRL